MGKRIRFYPFFRKIQRESFFRSGRYESGALLFVFEFGVYDVVALGRLGLGPLGTRRRPFLGPGLSGLLVHGLGESVGGLGQPVRGLLQDRNVLLLEGLSGLLQGG